MKVINGEGWCVCERRSFLTKTNWIKVIEKKNDTVNRLFVMLF